MTKRAIKLKIASPCQADWESMTGDEATRFCGLCKQNVYQLSNMSTEQVEELLLTRKGLRTCGRFYQRADGTILTSNCSVGVRQKRKKRVLQVFGAAAISASALGIGSALQPDSSASEQFAQEQTNEIIELRLGGISSMEVIPESKEPNEQNDPGHNEPVEMWQPENPSLIMGNIAVEDVVLTQGEFEVTDTAPEGE